MTPITRYRCDICLTEYETVELAAACEAKGRGREWPVGMMWRYRLHDHIRDPIVAAGHVPSAEQVTYAIATPGEPNKHEVKQLHWSAGSGWVKGADDLFPGGPTKGWAKRFGGAAGMAQPPDPSLPSFRRLVAALRAAGIEPTMFDGEKAVPLPEGA